MFATLDDGVTFKYPGQGVPFRPGFETKPDIEFNFNRFVRETNEVISS